MIHTKPFGTVTLLTIDRPERKNALNHEMQDALPLAFNQIQGDVAVRSVILTGAGGDFCSGADVKGMRTGGTIADVIASELNMDTHADQALAALAR